jgi:hypothetical protein
MRKQISHIVAALAFAALGVACGGGTSSVNMTAERAQGALKANTNRRMELIGCVKPAVSKAEGMYILEHVTPPAGELLPDASSSSTATLIPRGSWVRLGGPDMKKYVGRQVLISGDLVDAPTGTAGHGGTVKPGDYVRWNETPADTPLFAVETVKEQGDCKAE